MTGLTDALQQDVDALQALILAERAPHAAGAERLRQIIKAEDIEGTRFRHSQPGFAVFALEDQVLRLEFRDFDGRSVYRAAIPKAGA